MKADNKLSVGSLMFLRTEEANDSWRFVLMLGSKGFIFVETTSEKKWRKKRSRRATLKRNTNEKID